MQSLSPDYACDYIIIIVGLCDFGSVEGVEGTEVVDEDKHGLRIPNGEEIIQA
jgi:hypothetical protein